MLSKWENSEHILNKTSATVGTTDIIKVEPVDSAGSNVVPVSYRDNFGYSFDCTPNAELITTDKIRLVGAIFNGATVDANFWTSAVSTGTVTQVSSELVLTSGTANGHYARLYSVRRANWVTGSSQKYRAQMRFGDSGTTNVTRRWGVGWGATMPTVTDGAYFKLVGTALSVNTMANTTETSVASTSFNGTYTAPTLTNNNTYEILYTLSKVYFLINNILVHTAIFSTTHWTSGTTNFHAFADVNNTGNSAAVTMTFRMKNISRLGNFKTMPQYRYISNANTAQVLKYGGGILHSLFIGTAVANKTINVFDDTAGLANQIAGLTLPATTEPFGWDLDCPFFNGLTVTPNDTGLKITVVYE